MITLKCKPGFSHAFTGTDGEPKVVVDGCTLEGSDWEKARRMPRVAAALKSGGIVEPSTFRGGQSGHLDEVTFRTAAPATDETDFDLVEAANDNYPPVDEDQEDREG